MTHKGKDDHEPTGFKEAFKLP